MCGVVVCMCVCDCGVVWLLCVVVVWFSFAGFRLCVVGVALVVLFVWCDICCWWWCCGVVCVCVCVNVCVYV